MTEEQLREFLNENKADIERAVKAKLIDQMLASHQWSISSEISKVVNEFVSTEIVPEVKKHLADQKGPILEGAIKACSGIGDKLAEALVESAAKKLDPNSYQFNEITKALFGR